MGAAQRRRALDSSSRSGRNTLTSGLALDVEQALDGRAVGGHPLDGLRSAAGVPKPTRQLVRVTVVARCTATRVACAPKRTSSRSLRVRGERPVQPK